jgi:hypothetical protein
MNGVLKLNVQIQRQRVNKLNEQLLHLLVFHTNILTKCTVQISKIPSKKSRQAALRGGI